MNSLTTSTASRKAAPCPKSERSRRPSACPASELRRDSELNARGHAIIASVDHLIRQIDSLGDSTAEGDLLNKLELLGAVDPDEGTALGCLNHLSADCRGMRWILQQFADMLRCSTVPRSLADIDEERPLLPTPQSQVRKRRANAEMPTAERKSR